MATGEATYTPRRLNLRWSVLLGVLVGLTGLGAWSATAEATVYCVAASNPESIDASCTPGEGKTTIQAALSAAGTNGVAADTVRIGPGTFNAHSLSFDGFNQTGRVNIIGAGSGPGGTIISPTISNGTTLGYVLSSQNYGAGVGSISNLKVQIPAEANTATATFGIEGKNLSLNGVVVTSAKSSNQFGVSLQASTIQNSRILVPTSGETNTAVSLQASGPTGEIALTDSEIEGQVIIEATDDTTVSRVKLTTAGSGIVLGAIPDGGYLYLADTMIDTGTGVGRRALVMDDTQAGSAQDFTADVERTTIVGSGNSTRGIRFFARDGDIFQLNLRDSVILGQDLPVYATYGGTGIATVNSAYSAYDTTGPKARIVEPAENLTEGAGIINSAAPGFNPGFTNAASSDYSLLATSPLVDAGRTSPGSGADVAGNSRPVRKDCAAVGLSRHDLGSYEYQPPLPTATIVDGPAEGSTISDSTPTFTFASSFPCITPSFSIHVDPFGAATGLGGLPNTNTSWTTPLLPDGTQTLTVAAASEGGDLGDPTTRTFTVDATAPATTVTGKSLFRAIKGKATATFTLGSSEPGSTFACKFLTTGYRPCSSPLKIRNLRRGSYTLSVRATDGVGNVDPTPAVKKFRVR